MVMVIVIDDAKISQFLVVSEELVMVMMTMMPRFVGFLPIKSTNLVTGDGDDGDGDDGDDVGDAASLFYERFPARARSN